MKMASLLGWNGRRRGSRAGWPELDRSSRARRLALRPELRFLEDRLTPSGTIAITNAFLVNSSSQPVLGETAGENVYVEVQFTTQGLPASASFVISYTVNGLTMQTGELNLGAGRRRRVPGRTFLTPSSHRRVRTT